MSIDDVPPSVGGGRLRRMPNLTCSNCWCCWCGAGRTTVVTCPLGLVTCSVRTDYRLSIIMLSFDLASDDKGGVSTSEAVMVVLTRFGRKNYKLHPSVKSVTEILHILWRKLIPNIHS
jgi:hypothetical protein